MAGMDPLGDLQRSDRSPTTQYPGMPSRRRRDPLKWMRWAQQVKKTRKLSAEQEEQLGRISQGERGVPKEPKYTHLREAEAGEGLTGDERDLTDPDQRKEWVDEYEAALIEKKEWFKGFVEETMKAPRGTPEMTERIRVIDIERGEIEKAEQLVADERKNLDRVKHGQGAVEDLYALTKLQEQGILKASTRTMAPGMDGVAAKVADWLGLGMDLDEKLKEDPEFGELFVQYAMDNREAIKAQVDAYRRENENSTHILETIMANSPIMGIFESVAGLASIPAEALKALADGKGVRGAFEAAVGDLTPADTVGNVFSPLGIGTEDSWLRRRGRAMGEDVGYQLATLDANIEAQTGFSPFDALSLPNRYGIEMLGRMLGGNFKDWSLPKMGTAGQTKNFIYRIGWEAAIDPLNIVDFGGQAMKFKPSKILKEFAHNNSWLRGMPLQVWLKLDGYSKEAAAIADPKMRQVFLLERMFEETGVNVEFGRLAAESLKFHKEVYERLPEAGAELVQREAWRVVEESKRVQLGAKAAGASMDLAAARQIVAQEISKEQVIQDALVESAAFLDDNYDLALKLENHYGMPTEVLDSEFGYYMTIRDPKFAEWLQAHPTAKQILLGTEAKMSKTAFDDAMQSWEKGRIDELRGMNLEEKEAEIRKYYSQKHGLVIPDNINIFSRTPFEDLAKRAETDLYKVKQRFFARAAADVMPSVRAPDGLVDDGVREVEKAIAGNEAAVWERFKRLMMGAEDLRETVKGIEEGRSALMAANKQAGRASAELDEAAAVADEFLEGARELSDAARAGRVSRTFQRMFPELPLAEDADAAMSSMLGMAYTQLAQIKKGGTPLTKDAHRRLQKALDGFVETWGVTTNLAGRRRAIESLAREVKLILPGKMAREYARLAKKAQKAVDKLGTATEGLKPAGSVARAAARRAERKAEKAYEAAMKADFDKWSPEAKAKFVESVVDPDGVNTPGGHTSALNVYREHNVALPEDLPSLVRLATSQMSPDDMASMARWMDDYYTAPLAPSTAGKILDGMKVIYQRAILARTAGAMRDFWGTMAQGLMAAKDPQYVTDLEDARKMMGGNPLAWASAPGQKWDPPDIVLQLMGEGYLNTTVDEVTQVGNFRKIYEEGRIKKGKGSLVAKGLAELEDKGALASIAGAIAGEKAALRVKKITDAPIHFRIWQEQVQRLATYLQAKRLGASHREAVEEGYKMWGKFNEITRFDRKWLSRAFFFWAWRRASLPITVRNLLDHPIRSKMVLFSTAYAHNTAKERGAALHDTAEEYGVPEWFRRMGGWVLGIDENGNADAVGTGGSSYFGPTVGLLQSDLARALAHGDILSGGHELLKEIGRSSPPLFQQTAEFIFKKDLFSDENWYDPEGRSNVKAPPALYWFMNPDDKKKNPFEKFLGLEAQTDKDGQVIGLTMDPEVAWVMDWIPGLSALAIDISAMADPRQADLKGLGIEGHKMDLSLRKGILRQIGYPLYRFKMTTEKERQVMKAREALADSLENLTAGTLIRDQYGNIVVDWKTERGKKLKADRDKWRAEAEAAGEDPRFYIDQRMVRFHLHEYRVMEMDKRLKRMKDSEEWPQVKGVGLLPKMKEPPPPEASRIKRTREEEKKRAKRRLLASLGLKMSDIR